MEPSYIGLAVFAAVWLFGRALGSAALYGLMLSLPLGSTAFATLPALGGATPQIYTLFAVLLIVEAAAGAGGVAPLRAVFARQASAWLVLALVVLALAGAAVLPRLFEAATMVPFPVERSAVDAPLRPTSKNVTQSGYLLLDALLYFALSLQLLAAPRRARVVTAFLLWCSLHTGLGLIDLVAKYADLGDVFAPIRTANYANLSGDRIGRFARLTGSLPEASTFATMGLGCLAFSFVYWRRTGSRFALALAAANLLLLLLSTSTTAYVGLALLAVPLAWQAVTAWRRGAWSGRDLLPAGVAVAAAAAFVAVLAAGGALAPYAQLIDTMVFDKFDSQSGVERSHFNVLSLRSLLDTYGLGVGLGSSRTSSWPVAVLAQLGVAGAVLMAMLVARLWRGMRGVAPAAAGADLRGAGSAVAAAALGGLLAASLSGATANPGPIFFIALAVIESWRRHAGS